MNLIYTANGRIFGKEDLPGTCSFQNEKKLHLPELCGPIYFSMKHIMILTKWHFNSSAYIKSASEMSGLHAVNLTQPVFNNMEIIYRNTVDKGIKLINLDEKVE